MTKKHSAINVSIPFLLVFSFLLVMPPAGSSSQDGMCEYVTNLEQPLPRAQFLKMRKDMYLFNQNRSSADARFALNKVSEFNHTMERQIDEVSYTCLGCHDEVGKMVKKDGAQPKNTHTELMATMASSHRVGVDYERKTLEKSHMKSSAEFPENVMLINGSMSCVTCHDPLNKTGNHLVVSDRAALCFVCHNM